MHTDPYDTVLIAVLKSAQDLRRAQKEAWYRIPVAKLPPRASTARYIAFYQPAGVFGSEGGVVRYLAEVRDWEMLPRRELLPAEAGHPRADVLYYKVSLGPLQRLTPPIRCGRWKRFAFIVTHWERLQQAAKMRDLLHGSLWQERLWGALRRAGLLE
ncbi:MAG: hypothetical protein JXA37_03485 [Chloroflexia bacterium]|nr:hypothetical protein [Chloroflexia bacterium]